MSRAFRDYLDKFMKIFPIDFIVYNDTDTHLQKHKMCFHKCRKIEINLNPNKCAFMVFSRMIPGFIVSKERELLDPKKIQKIVQMHVLTNSSVQWNGLILHMLHQEFCIHNDLNYQTHEEDIIVFVNFKVLRSIGVD